MKKLAIITFFIGTSLVFYGVWLIQSNVAYEEASARRAGCDQVYGVQPANIREKQTCLAEADELEQAYKNRTYMSLGVGVFVLATSAYVLTRHRRIKKRVLKHEHHTKSGPE